MASKNKEVVPVAEQAEEEMEAGTERAEWEGSDVSSDEIDWLRRTRRIPVEVECRRPGDELVPDARDGEYVVFASHFERGFGLPTSGFMQKFLERFGIQPHHLPANAITTMSSHAAFCEAYVGVKPTVRTWAKYFTFAW